MGPVLDPLLISQRDRAVDGLDALFALLWLSELLQLYCLGLELS